MRLNVSLRLINSVEPEVNMGTEISKDGELIIRLSFERGHDALSDLLEYTLPKAVTLTYSQLRDAFLGQDERSCGTAIMALVASGKLQEPNAQTHIGTVLNRMRAVGLTFESMGVPISSVLSYLKAAMDSVELQPFNHAENTFSYKLGSKMLKRLGLILGKELKEEDHGVFTMKREYVDMIRLAKPQITFFKYVLLVWALGIAKNTIGEETLGSRNVARQLKDKFKSQESNVNMNDLIKVVDQINKIDQLILSDIITATESGYRIYVTPDVCTICNHFLEKNEYYPNAHKGVEMGELKTFGELGAGASKEIILKAAIVAACAMKHKFETLEELQAIIKTVFNTENSQSDDEAILKPSEHEELALIYRTTFKSALMNGHLGVRVPANIAKLIMPEEQKNNSNFGTDTTMVLKVDDLQRILGDSSITLKRRLLLLAVADSTVTRESRTGFETASKLKGITELTSWGCDVIEKVCDRIRAMQRNDHQQQFGCHSQQPQNGFFGQQQPHYGHNVNGGYQNTWNQTIDYIKSIVTDIRPAEQGLVHIPGIILDLTMKPGTNIAFPNLCGGLQPLTITPMEVTVGEATMIRVMIGHLGHDQNMIKSFVDHLMGTADRSIEDLISVVAGIMGNKLAPEPSNELIDEVCRAVHGMGVGIPVPATAQDLLIALSTAMGNKARQTAGQYNPHRQFVW